MQNEQACSLTIHHIILDSVLQQSYHYEDMCKKNKAHYNNDQ